MDSRIIPAIVGVMALLVVGLGVLIYVQLMPESEIRYDSDGDTEFTGSAIDSGARIEIEVLRSQIEALTQQIERLEQRIGGLQAPTSTGPQGGGDQGVIQRDGPNQIIDQYAQTVLIANRRKVNTGLQIASPSFLESIFGRPRDVLTDKCQGMTNERLASKLRTAQIGPVRVRMLEPALESLGRVFDKIKSTDPDLYARINTAGALCVRHIRGAPGRTSTHAFGLSLDLNIDGKLDRLGDGKTQLGLTILADFFRTEGWYWGASFGREDSMHFEVSRGLVEKWVEEGRL